MGLTVSRKKAKNIAVRRKNERILTVTRKKMLTVKKSVSVQCRKVAVLAVVTDCGECNKQALLEIEKMSENNTMPPELLLLTPLPDVLHIGKSLKCSWLTWFVDLNGQMSNLVLIRTLRDSTDSDVRKLLRKMLTLEYVRNNDRMAVEPTV